MNIIKRISIVLVIMIGITVLVGCGKKSNTIIGTWTYGEYAYTFNSDETGNYSSYGEKMNFTYKDNGSEVEILYTGNTIASVYKYRIEKKKLIINDSFGKEVIYIKK